MLCAFAVEGAGQAHDAPVLAAGRVAAEPVAEPPVQLLDLGRHQLVAEAPVRSVSRRPSALASSRSTQTTEPGRTARLPGSGRSRGNRGVMGTD